MTDRKRNEEWRARFGGHCTVQELDAIDRYWKRIGSKIASGARFKDRPLGKKTTKK